jgi:hypothetical protein
MAALRFPIKVGSVHRQVECFWAAPPAAAEIADLKSWSNSTTESTRQVDAMELAHLAAIKWEATCDWGTVVKSLSEMEAAIHRRPTVEVTAMLLVRAPWFEAGLLGVCLFHRTWASNVFVDFLAVHPSTMAPGQPISGVGIGLLYHLCEVARRLGAPVLWGETTESSAAYYTRLFGLTGLTDQLTISAIQRDAFCREVPQRWHPARSS